MHAVEIVKEFHTLDDKGRAAVLKGEGPLGKAIAELPDAEREGVKKALAQDFDSSGKLTAKGELPIDERVAANLPSHPFRSGASLPDGVKLDVVGKAHEVSIPEPDAAAKASASGVPDGKTEPSKPKPSETSSTPPKPIEPKPAAKLSEPKPAEKPIEPKPAEKPIEPKPAKK